jgi:hypothetical protein
MLFFFVYIAGVKAMSAEQYQTHPGQAGIED